jgi:hypothetical protein
MDEDPSLVLAKQIIDVADRLYTALMVEVGTHNPSFEWWSYLGHCIVHRICHRWPSITFEHGGAGIVVKNYDGCCSITYQNGLGRPVLLVTPGVRMVSIKCDMVLV